MLGFCISPQVLGRKFFSKARARPSEERRDSESLDVGDHVNGEADKKVSA